MSIRYFNPRAPCGARLHTHPIWQIGNSISIHAPRVGRDFIQCPVEFMDLQFQSTRPVWGATASAQDTAGRVFDFNPRAPCGARRYELYNYGTYSEISIHAPRVGRDSRRSKSCATRQGFQSTRPVWGATRPLDYPASFCRDFNPRAPCGARPYTQRSISSPPNISIHAPRVGRDRQQPELCLSLRNFNPRAPCGARQSYRRICHNDLTFQSTRPVWGAT